MSAAAGAAELRGIVQDRTGAALPGTDIVVSQDDSGRTFAAESAPNGTWALPGLPAGQYRIWFSMQGFENAEKRVRLSDADSVSMTQVLDAASVRTEVSVAAGVEMIETSRIGQRKVLDTQELVSLPTASRNVTHLIVAEAGVNAPLPDRTGKGMNLATAPGTQADDAAQSLNPSVNGARTSSNSLQLNGLDITNMMNAAGGLGNNMTIPLDSMQEVEVQTALYAASTGRNGGGNIQLTLRSGANRFHGGAYHYLQNERLNANEFFLNSAGTSRPQFRRNESGINVGGPIFRNKTFFYAAVQRTDFLSGYATNAIARASFPAGLSDVRTQTSLAEVANRWIESGSKVPDFGKNFLQALRAFPSDQQPGLISQFFSNPDTLTFRRLTPGDIHPVAVNILNQKRNGQFLVPSIQPNFSLVPARSSFGEEYLQTLVIPTFFNSWSGIGTLEHNVSEKNRLKLHYVKSAQYIREAFGWADASPSPTLGETPGWTAQLADTHVFSSRWINELRGGFFELYNTRISLNRDIKNSTLGINNPLENAIGGLASLMPTIDIVGSSGNSAGIGNAWDFFDRQRVINIQDTMSFITGRHSIQFGGEWRRSTLKGEYMARTNGDLDYDNWVLFLTGHGASGGGSDLDQGDTRRHFKMNDFSGFFQDDIRIHPRLTLNLGVRYDLFGSPVEVQGRIGNFYLPDTAAKLGVEPGYQIPSDSIVFEPGFNPLQIGLYVAPGTPLDMTQVHPAKYASTLAGDHNNFAPRVGFAWKPVWGASLVVRGGYGVFYDRPSGVFKGDMQLSAPFFIYQNVPAPQDMANPYPSLTINPFQIPLSVQMVKDANGKPSWRRYDGSAFPATEPFNPKNFSFIDPLVRTPYMQQWTFNVQWEPASGNMIDLRYVGSSGTGLLAKLNLAQPLDPRTTGVNGFTDIKDKTGALIDPNFFVPSQFLGLSRTGGFNLRSNWGHSSYNSAQLSYRRRFSKGLLMNAAYTFSKSIDNVSSDSSQIQHDAFNSRLNRGLSDFDRTHRLTSAWSYDLPSRFASRWMKAVFGGWNQAGMLTAQSGAPFSVFGNSTRNAYFAQVSSTRLSFAPGMTLADATGSGRVQDRLMSYFSTAAFTDSLDSWGNAGRNILRGPSQRELDLSLGKRIRVAESVFADFRWEAYNVTNTPTFANPASTFAANGSGTAGQITSTIGGPRTMQGAIRLSF